MSSKRGGRHQLSVDTSCLQPLYGRGVCDESVKNVTTTHTPWPRYMYMYVTKQALYCTRVRKLSSRAALRDQFA